MILYDYFRFLAVSQNFFMIISLIHTTMTDMIHLQDISDTSNIINVKIDGHHLKKKESERPSFGSHNPETTKTAFRLSLITTLENIIDVRKICVDQRHASH
ncbi:hypothetical protein ACJX0J_011009 [Zea mays]